MANWTTLKTAIANVIKTNGNQEITGQVLQNTLNSIVSAVGENAAFVGIATPATNPGIPDGPVFYIASAAGTYSNFNGLVVNSDEVPVLQFNNGEWTKKDTGLAPKSLMAISSAGIRYTYWQPTTDPVLQTVSSAMRRITYSKLTIVDILSQSVFSTFSFGTPGVINIDSNGSVLAYAKVMSPTRIELHYDYISRPNGTAEVGDYEKITDISKVIPLCIVEKGIMEDILKIVSVTRSGNVPSLSTDIKNLNAKINTLYPGGSGNAPILFNKYQWDICGDIETSTRPFIELFANLHVKHEFFFVHGGVDFTQGKKPIVELRIQDNIDEVGNTAFEYALDYSDFGNLGVFLDYVPIPPSAWEKIDFERGYRASIVCISPDGSQDLKLHIEEAYACDYPGHNNEVIFKNEQVEDTIAKVTELSSVVQVTEMNNLFGNDSTKVLNNSFPYAAHTGYSATTTNSGATNDGFLTEITTRVKNKGVFAVKVGLLDQYSRFVVSRSFNLTLEDGLNKIDVSHLNIPIAKGEQIAISCVSILGSDSSSISYQENSSPIRNELFYGPDNGEWKKLNTTHGGEIILSYKIKQVETIFALKSQIESLNKQIENQNSTINSLRHVYDVDGNPYKISVVNGGLQLRPAAYRFVLALGNSLTSHAYAESIGYYGDKDWAMASTNKKLTTWTSHLETILRQKVPKAVVDPYNIAAWETNYMSVDLDQLFAGVKPAPFDLVIIRAGENGVAGPDYTKGVERLVTYLRNRFEGADIIMTDMFWHDSTKEAGFKAVAEKYKYQYVSFGNIADKCLLGQMLAGKDDNLHPIIHSGVAHHCTDVCFFDFANILASALGYPTISGKYKVNINASVQYSINQTSQIENGLVTILTYGSSTSIVRAINASSGKPLPVHLAILSDVEWINVPSPLPTQAFVFQMPGANVNVFIS